MEDGATILLHSLHVDPKDENIQVMIEALRANLDVPWLELVVFADGGGEQRFASGLGGDGTNDVGCRVPLDLGPGFSAELAIPQGDHDRRAIQLAQVGLAAILRLGSALRREAILQSTIDASDDAVLIFDHRCAIAYANPAADRLISSQTEEGLAVRHPDDRREPLFSILSRTAELLLDERSPDTRWHGRLALSDGRQIACTIRTIHHAGGALERCAVVVIAERPAGEPANFRDFAASYGLSPREEEVARLLLSGFSVAAVAEKLGISPHTARDHVKRLYRKTGTCSRDDFLERVAIGTCAPPVHPPSS